MGTGTGPGVGLIEYTLTTRRISQPYKQNKTNQKTYKQKGCCLIKKQTNKQTDTQTKKNKKKQKQNKKKTLGQEQEGTGRETQLPVYKLGEPTVIRVALRSEYIQFNSVSFSGLFNSVRMKGLFKFYYTLH